MPSAVEIEVTNSDLSAKYRTDTFAGTFQLFRWGCIIELSQSLVEDSKTVKERTGQRLR